MKNLNIKLKLLCLFLLIVFSFLSSGATFDFQCSGLKGQRTNYFENNQNGVSNEFIDTIDSLGETHIRIIYDDMADSAIFVTEDPESWSLLRETNVYKLKKLYHDSQQVTFVGVIQNAAVMVTIYPITKTVIYGMQSNWSTFSEGTRAWMFHGKCETVEK